MSVNRFVTAVFILITSAVTISAFPLKLSLLAENGLFEGDLKIPESLIRAYYNLSEMDGPETSDISRRAAANNVQLWVDGIVPYEFSQRISLRKCAMVRKAMDRWEATSCLRFVPKEKKHDDYICFQDSEGGCHSYVGRQGGRQVINLERNYCETYRIFLHEIGHAIGFWHEQSRPDRDDYVRIIGKNIMSGESNNFMKKQQNEIDSLGSSYDYGSIMHYSETAFAKRSCLWCKTIKVTNRTAYTAQGSPRLGKMNDLSPSDVQQANSLYPCSGSGVRGTLIVKVRYGRNLKNTDGRRNLSDPYVEIIAVDYQGTSHRKITDYKSGTRNPTWNKTLRFGRTRWQFFLIKVWDNDYSADDALSVSEKVVVTSGRHYNQKHCDDARCSGYIRYHYSVR